MEDAKVITEPFKSMVEELDVEIEWAKTHGTDASFRKGRISGLSTAKRVISRIAKHYTDDGK